MSRPGIGLALALLALRTQAAAQDAQPSPQPRELEVRVVEVAGGRAYLEPGEAAGLRRGDRVRFGKQRYEVLGTTANNAVIEPRANGHKPGTRGRAEIAPAEQAATAKRLAAPPPLAAFRGQWPKPRVPADAQHPKPVPLGPSDGGERSRLALSLGGSGVVPLGGGEPIARGELRARLHYEPFHELPARFDADVAGQLWAASDLDARPGRDSRPIARVRQLEAAYGGERELFGALGRLRYAARTLGTLDGAKLQAPLGAGLTLGAFGGFVPDPLDGSPETQAARFGAEVGFDDPTLALRPSAAITAHASRFDGELDERRLNAFVDLFPGAHRLGTYAELSIHGSNNPWNAPAQELTAAGADMGFRFGELELGARADLQRPERSRWLAAFLPPEWLCVSRPSPPSATPETCYGDDVRYLGSADATVRLERVVLNGGVTAGTSERGDSDQLGGFAGVSVLRIAEVLRVDTSLLATTGSLLRTLAASIGVGAALAGGALDVSLRYRPALSRYEADNDQYLEHGAGARVELMPEGELGFALDADALAGRDVDVLLMQGLLTWRPLGG